MSKKDFILIISLLFLTTGLISCNNNQIQNSSLYSTPNQERYHVTFMNYDASILFYTSVEYGGTAVYQGETPSRPASKQYSYSFIGWDVSLTNITSDLIAIAQYEQSICKYEVKFVNDDGTLLYETEVKYGDNVKYEGDVPTKVSDKNYIYTFIGWDKSLNNITDNTTFTATYTETNNINKIEIYDSVNILNTYDTATIIESILTTTVYVEFKDIFDENNYGNGKFVDINQTMFDNNLYELDLTIIGQQQITINYLGFTSQLSIQVYDDLSNLNYNHYKGDGAYQWNYYDNLIQNLYLYENNIATVGYPNSFERKEYSYIDENTIRIGDFLYDLYQKNQWEQFVTIHVFDEPLYKTYIMEPYDCYGRVQIDLYSSAIEGYCHYSFGNNNETYFTHTCSYIIEDNIIRIVALNISFEILENNQLKYISDNQ